MVGIPAMPPALRAKVITRLVTAAARRGAACNAFDAEPRHGLSIFGELKYPADFKHFDYVNPDAPKGGRMVTMGTGDVNTFDSFNQFIVKGDAAQELELLFDSLMIRAQDEPDAVYGLVARSGRRRARQNVRHVQTAPRSEVCRRNADHGRRCRLYASVF